MHITGRLSLTRIALQGSASSTVQGEKLSSCILWIYPERRSTSPFCFSHLSVFFLFLFFQSSCGSKNTTRRFRDLVVTELVYNLFYLPFSRLCTTAIRRARAQPLPLYLNPLPPHAAAKMGYLYYLLHPYQLRSIIQW